MPGGLHPVTKYKQKPSIEITEAKSKELVQTRLDNEYIPGIKKWVLGFDDFPLPSREALIDMAYNAGVGRDATTIKGKFYKANGLHQYTHLKRAIEQGDWFAASKACHSSSSRPERNDWRREHFEEAGRIAARTKGSK